MKYLFIAIKNINIFAYIFHQTLDKKTKHASINHFQDIGSISAKLLD
jgi:hypothetical protein